MSTNHLKILCLMGTLGSLHDAQATTCACTCVEPIQTNRPFTKGLGCQSSEQKCGHACRASHKTSACMTHEACNHAGFIPS